MPRGNLCVVHQPSGVVIATGQQSSKAIEETILKHMTEIAEKTEKDTVTSSYQVFTPYKLFGDKGVKAYSLPKKDLIPDKEEKPQEDNSNEPVVHEL